jgi:hypothetical protein
MDCHSAHPDLLQRRSDMNPKRPYREVLAPDDRDEFLKRDEPVTGPSDSSDSAADLIGIERSDDTTDRNGTGERRSVGDTGDLDDAADISADRIVQPEEAGLGGGLDQAEEAQLGITDEEIADLQKPDEE